MKLVVSFALYLAPLVALPFVCRDDPTKRRVALLALLIAPLLGALTCLTVMGDLSVGLVLVTSPFALLPLGLWAAVLAAASVPAVRWLGRPAYGVVAVPPAGAVAGFLAMLAFRSIVVWSDAARAAVLPYVVTGAVVGWVLGILVAHEVSRAATPGRATAE